LTSETPTTRPASADESADGSADDSGALASPDIMVGSRRILLTPHNCFACGQLNVHGLRLDLHARSGRCWTELALPERFEGWEGIAHGGIICTILDEVMAWAIVGEDAWAVTARLQVELKRPISVGTPIRGEGWIVKRRRRLLETGARIVDVATGTELATATAVYVAVSAEKQRELKDRYAYRMVSEMDDSPDSVDRSA
jgi:acyl-coenzyme A thioesterase PaaI-like protein